MNTTAGETYQERVRYYRRKAEQERNTRKRNQWRARMKSNDNVSIDFDEALYNFKQTGGFDRMYSKARRHAKRHAQDHLSFYRDDEQGYIGGVCAGIADKMNWDVTAVRAVTVVLGLIFTLPTVIAYIAGTVFLRKKHLAYYGPDERDFWKTAGAQATRPDADFTFEEKK